MGGDDKHDKAKRSDPPRVGKVSSKLQDAPDIDEALKSTPITATLAARMAGSRQMGMATQSQAYSALRIDDNRAKHRIYVGNLHPHVTEADLTAAFSTLAPVNSVVLPMENSLKHRGYCFVEFKDEAGVETALRHAAEKICFGGMRVKVRPSRRDAMPPTPTEEALVKPEGEATDVPVPELVPPSNDESEEKQQLRQERPYYRYGDPKEIAKAIAAARGLVPNSGTESAAGQPAAAAGAASTAIVISGMARTQEEANAELVEDVRGECGKFGRVLDVHFYMTDPKEGPNVAVEFSNEAEARACAQRMNGRLFDGRPLRSSVLTREYYAQIKGA